MVTRNTTRGRARDEVDSSKEVVRDPWDDEPGVDTVEDQDDPWGTPSGGGNYPALIDLIGCLLLLEHVKIETVPRPNSRNADDTQERLSADTTVIDGPEGCSNVGDTFDEMFWSQSPIVNAMQKTLRKGKASILGRLARVDINKKSKTHGEIYRDPIDLEDAMKGRRDIEFAWILEPPNADDLDTARKWLKETRGGKR